MNIRCWLFGHKWQFGKDMVICSRCPAFLVHQIRWRDKANHAVIVYKGKWGIHASFYKPTDFSKHTIVPIETLQVAEAACREAKYHKTAKELRRCLTAER